MDVSVIIPTLNEEKNIKICLESIAAQETDAKYEIIVCDGKSDDRTAEIAEKYANKVILSEVRSIGLQRNYGAESANGRYLLFIDADTVLPKDYIKWGVNKFKDYPDLLGFCAGFRFSNPGPKMVFLEKLNCSWFEFNDKIGFPTLLGFNTFVTADAFRRSGGFRDVPLEDADYARRMHKMGKVRFFTDNFVITSPRRLEEMGLLSAMRYYFEFDLITRYPGLKDILFYNNYVGCRPDSEKLCEAFNKLGTPAKDSAELTCMMNEYVRKRADKFTEEVRQQFNETSTWAKKTNERAIENIIAVSQSISYITARKIDADIIDKSVTYIKKSFRKI